MKSNRGAAAPRGGRLAVEQLEARQLLAVFQPSVAEQIFLERLNDARANPAAYGATVGVDLSGIAPSQPLAFNASANLVARGQSLDMNNRQFFGHTNPDGADPALRLTNGNIPWSSWGESLAAGAELTNPEAALRALIVDAGVEDLGHRKQLLADDATYRTQNQVGIGIASDGTGPSKNYFTIDTLATTDTRPFLTGVIYADANFNGKYDAGEGIGNATITITRGSGAAEQTVTTAQSFDTGGYSIQIDPGVYRVKVSGTGFSSTVTRDVTILNSNFRLNVTPTDGNAVANGTGAQRAWVSMLYRDALGRTPSASEIEGWVTGLQRGLSRDTVVLGFFLSPEYVTRLINTYFQQYLDRDADATAIQTFALGLQTATTLRTLQGSILSSTEYYFDNGATADGFVKGLYQDLLHRDVSGTEANGWLDLAATDRRAVINGILASEEYNQGEVKGLYQNLLRREADPAGLTDFARQLSLGFDDRRIIGQFLVSPEYFNNARNVLWVSQLYQDVLGRTPAASELNGWVQQTSGGVNHATIANGFVNSPENQLRTVEMIFRRFLGRAPDDNGRQVFTEALKGGLRVTDVLSGVLASQEYYDSRGATDDSYIRALYQDVLGRAPSDDEVSNWTTAMTGGVSRARVSALFLGSPEYQQQLAQSLSLRYLRRSPTTSELQQLINQQSSAPEGMLATNLLSGAEYFLVTTT